MKSLFFKVTVLVFMIETKVFQTTYGLKAQKVFHITGFIKMVIIYVKTQDKS